MWPRQVDMGYLSTFFQELLSQNPIKVDFKTYRKTKWKGENLPSRLTGFSLFFIKSCELSGGGGDSNNYFIMINELLLANYVNQSLHHFQSCELSSACQESCIDSSTKLQTGVGAKLG